MKKTTGEKKVGFYLVIAAALLSLVSLLVYRTVLSRLGMVYGLSVIPAIVVVMVMTGVKIAGAKEVIGVDASELGVEQARKNAALNGLENVASFVCEDVFELLPRLEKEGEKFDVVILDPPAFTKSRNSIKNAIKGYREINLRGMKLVKDGGYLCTCSCSHFMDYELFTKTINQAAHNVHKRLRQVEYRTQAPDHPILWAADESYYLKFYIFQVVDEK